MRTMTNQTQLFEAALGINAPWYVQGVDFGTELTIAVDFVAGSRFAYLTP
jgi:transposase